MLHNEARELLVEAYEKTGNAKEVAKYFGIDKRKNWVESISDFDKERLVFLDESGVNTNMTRITDVILEAPALVDKVSLNTPVNTAILSLIRINGETSYTTYSGEITKYKFVEYLKNILIPTLHNGDIIVMDNKRSHHVKEVSETINNS